MAAASSVTNLPVTTLRPPLADPSHLWCQRLLSIAISPPFPKSVSNSHPIYMYDPCMMLLLFMAIQQPQMALPVPIPRPSYASIVIPASIIFTNTSTWPPKYFFDEVVDSSASQVPIKPVLLCRAESAFHFLAEEVRSKVEPFKLSLVGKFSFGRPPMNFIQNFFVSLALKGYSQVSSLNDKHIMIKLELEEDYCRIWIRQT